LVPERRLPNLITLKVVKPKVIESFMKKFLIRAPKIVALIVIAFLVNGCASTGNQVKSLEATLLQYEQVIRWSQWDGAVDFLAPQSLKENPVTSLDMDRLRLFRVTRYVIRSSIPYNEGMGFGQVVEVSLFNRNRAIEKRVIDKQDWRFDSVRGRWFLHSGLLDVTSAR
jgi:hypothetical protein